ncbi:MAG: 16S rRNA (adenine(1518)-N(6)/adenine(1519)-N(6))-dimethyltransferase RsmA [Chloroflexi bacterium]|nr:16S rRNA (adenine(1518)-N(6)/adenine(1519)-N(6))-dimethyltransferase RsmA [Chloroflexota bacterium]
MSHLTHPKTLLAAHGLEPKKSLGQNFLSDEGILRRITAAADIAPSDEILEIGPGLGALTVQLAQAAQRVIAVELDGRLLPILAEQCAPYPHITIVEGDILEQEAWRWFTRPYKVVANVPYYITGAILRHLLSAELRPECMVLTVQKEVAERLTAAPGDLSILAVSVQFYGQPRVVTTLPAGAFWPRPKVDSAVVVIDLRQRPVSANRVTDEELFFRLVKAGFSQKRKQLHKNLRTLGYSREQIGQFLGRAAIAPERRAETLTIDEWVALWEAVNHS